MASVTLAESAKLSLNMLMAGVIENVITINRFYQLLPFSEIEGNALAYNRENALGDVQYGGVGGVITAKAAATFTAVTSSLTTILGDAEVNGLIQATRSNINDQKAIQVASKAKSLGRKYQDGMINGDGTADSFPGLLSLVDPTQTITANAGAGNGDVLTFAYLDQLIDMVTDKDGQVDYILMHARTLRSYLALLRALGGNSASDIMTLPNGEQVPAYRNIPIFRNDYIPITQTQGTSTNCTTVFAGTLDDGSMSHGISGLTATNEASGMQVEEVGISETKDETITRVKWYCGLALYSLKGLAAAKGITN